MIADATRLQENRNLLTAEALHPGTITLQPLPAMTDLPPAHAGLKASLFDDGFAVAIVAACVAGAFTAACAVVAIWYAIADLIERIAA
jgi:hypothetical protein